MKKKRFLLTAFVLVFAACGMNAQSAQVKNAAKSSIIVTAYDKSGNVIGKTGGVFVTADGEAVSSWSALSTAASAEVSDFNGNTYHVRSIIGVNDLYDVCHFRVDTKKSPTAVMAKSVLPKGGKVWLVGQESKSMAAIPFDVEREETFMDKYSYYIFAYNDKTGISGSPFVNGKGEVVGLLKQSSSSLDTHAVDARYAAGLTTNAIMVGNPLYAKTGIRLQMPSDKKDAQLMVMFSADQCDSAKYAGYVADYVTMFPDDVYGYSVSALHKVETGDFSGADADMQTAIRKSANKAEAHSEFSRVMYQKLVYSDDSLFNKWTFDRALDEAEQAYELDPQPAYRHRMGQILFSKKEYSKAYDIFSELSRSSMKNSEVFFEAAQCKTQLGGSNEEILALLDSAVACCRMPYSSVDAPYVLTRGQLRDAMENYRGALADYNLYDSIMAGRASADFYYTRYKCESNMRQYQQALNDIAHAAYIATHGMQPIYLAELASLQLRVGKLDDAVRTADMCLHILPEMTDALVIKGVALNGLKKKNEALECLQKAKELGDPRGDEYIKKYKK